MRLRGRGRRLGLLLILGTLLATGVAHAAASSDGADVVPALGAPLLILDRVLCSAAHYPPNYAFIPQTYSDGGDPLDVPALCQEPLAPLPARSSRTRRAAYGGAAHAHGWPVPSQTRIGRMMTWIPANWRRRCSEMAVS